MVIWCHSHGARPVVAKPTSRPILPPKQPRGATIELLHDFHHAWIFPMAFFPWPFSNQKTNAWMLHQHLNGKVLAAIWEKSDFSHFANGLKQVEK